jgi:hypothetical protein
MKEEAEIALAKERAAVAVEVAIDNNSNPEAVVNFGEEDGGGARNIGGAGGSSVLDRMMVELTEAKRQGKDSVLGQIFSELLVLQKKQQLQRKKDKGKKTTTDKKKKKKKKIFTKNTTKKSSLGIDIGDTNTSTLPPPPPLLSSDLEISLRAFFDKNKSPRGNKVTSASWKAYLKESNLSLGNTNAASPSSSSLSWQEIKTAAASATTKQSKTNDNTTAASSASSADEPISPTLEYSSRVSRSQAFSLDTSRYSADDDDDDDDDEYDFNDRSNDDDLPPSSSLSSKKANNKQQLDSTATSAATEESDDKSNSYRSNENDDGSEYSRKEYEDKDEEEDEEEEDKNSDSLVNFGTITRK